MTNNTILEPLLNNYDDDDYYVSLDDEVEINTTSKLKNYKKLHQIFSKNKSIVKFNFMDKGKKVTKIII
jgi:hypothetical protein